MREDERKELVEGTGNSGQQRPPSIEHSDHVLLGRHQIVLQFLSGEEVMDDVVVDVAAGPHEDEVARPESAVLEQTGELAGTDDGHGAGLAAVDDELVASLVAARCPDLVLECVDRDGELESMVHDRLSGDEVRDVD